MLSISALLTKALINNDFDFIKQYLTYNDVKIDDGLFDNTWNYDRFKTIPSYKELVQYINNGRLPQDELVFYINDWCSGDSFINFYGVSDLSITNAARGILKVEIWKHIKKRMIDAIYTFINDGDIELVGYYCAIIEYFSTKEVNFDEFEKDLMLII